MAGRTHKSGAGRPPSQRQLRVGELIRHAVSEMLQRGDVQDPQLERTPVTVPEVRMTPDLKRAKVFVMPLGGTGGDEVVEALQRSRRFLRGGLARRVELKFVPELDFALDERFDTADRIDELLRSPTVARDLDDGE